MFTWSGDLKGFRAAGKTFVVVIVVVVSTDAPLGKKTKTDYFGIHVYVKGIQTGENLLRYLSNTLRCFSNRHIYNSVQYFLLHGVVQHVRCVN